MVKIFKLEALILIDELLKQIFLFFFQYLKLGFGCDAYFGDKKKAFTEAAEAAEAIEAAFSLEQVREVQYLQSQGAPK